MRLTILALLAMVIAAPAYAQTECSPDRCTFRFEEAARDGWGPDWAVEALPLAYQPGDNKVANGAGSMRVKTGTWTTFVGNNTHLRWDVGNFRNASAIVGFPRVWRIRGWYDKLTDENNDYNDCYWWQEPERLGEFSACILVADTGDGWVAACLGGDLLAFSQSVMEDHEVEPQGFAILAAVQKLPSEERPRVLGYVQLPAIPFGPDRWNLSVTIDNSVPRPEPPIWRVRIKAGPEGQEMLGTSFNMAAAPWDGGIGFVGANMPASSCIEAYGGKIVREVAVHEVVAWR